MRDTPATPAPGRGIGWLVLFLLPTIALAVRHWGWAPREQAGDYAQYLLHAKALVEGRPYAETGYLYHPDAWLIGPRAYPPGLPLTLAPIVALGGVHSPLIRVLMLLSLGAFAYLAWRRLAMEVEPWQAAAGAGFAAFALEARGATLAPISDPGFAALLWGMVLAVDTATRWSWRRSTAVAVLGGAALAYRLAGVALVGAFGLFVLFSWKRHRARTVVPFLAWGAAGVAGLAVGLVTPETATSMLQGTAGLTSRLGMLVSEYTRAPLEGLLYPTTNGTANLVYHLTAMVLAAVGLVVLGWHARRSFLMLTCVVYVAMLLASPVADTRYVWPLFPVGACALALGLTRVLEWAASRRPAFPSAVTARALTVAVLAAALYTDLRRPRPASLVGRPDTEALFAWLRETSRSSPMRVVFTNPRVLTLETGVPAMGNVMRSAPGHVLAYDERGITHVIAEPDPRSDCLQRFANAAIAAYPARFALAYENQGFRVYRVLPAMGPVDSAFRRLSWDEVNVC